MHFLGLFYSEIDSEKMNLTEILAELQPKKLAIEGSFYTWPEISHFWLKSALKWPLGGYLSFFRLFQDN